jgi:hypothetical protein
MDKLFGEVDHVEGGELDRDGSQLGMEMTAYREIQRSSEEESPVSPTDDAKTVLALWDKDKRL